MSLVEFLMPENISNNEGEPKAKVERRGRPKMTPEQKKNAKALKAEKRKAHIRQLVLEGKLPLVDANRIAGELKIDLGDLSTAPPPDIEEDPAISAVADKSLDVGTHATDEKVNRKGLRGAAPTYLCEKEKSDILAYMDAGFSKHAATLSAGITYHRFTRQYRTDKGFREAVMTRELALPGMCQARIFEAAMNGDLNAAYRYITIAGNARDNAFKNRILHQEFRLKKRAVEAQLESLPKSARPSFSCLSDQELEDYETINNKIKEGGSPSVEELGRLGFYTAKLLRANSQNAPAVPVTDFVADAASRPLSLGSSSNEQTE